MYEIIDAFYQQMMANPVSKTFFVIIVTYFFVTILFEDEPWFRPLSNHAATNLTTLGILGTFLGVSIGLTDFNINEPDSIGKLLDGLKIAFGTSITGIALAIAYRIIHSYKLHRKQQSVTEAGATEILNKLIELNETNKEGFENLKRTLSAETDTSIVGQLQRLRNNISDLEQTNKTGFGEQIKAFRLFADEMSEAFSKAIIEELQAVIREFNEKISEQFGENFKQLNNAVGRLLEWQENYRDQMDVLKASLDNSIEGIKESQISLDEIEKSTQAIPTHVSQLSEIYGRIKTQTDEIESTLAAFAEIKEKATDAFPEIQKNLENYTTNLKATTEEQTALITDSIKNLTENVSGSITKHQETQETMLKELNNNFSSYTNNVETIATQQTTVVNESINNMKESLENSLTEQRKTQKTMLEELQTTATQQTTVVNESINNMKESLENSLTEQQNRNQQMSDGLQTAFNETLSNATNAMSDSIKQLDEAMQTEIESTIRAMAENLSGITERFVQDYNPLLENTKRIIEISERAQADRADDNG